MLHEIQLCKRMSRLNVTLTELFVCTRWHEKCQEEYSAKLEAATAAQEDLAERLADERPRRAHAVGRERRGEAQQSQHAAQAL